jgi:HSP20 family protein
MSHWSLNYFYIINPTAVPIEFLGLKSYILIRERGCCKMEVKTRITPCACVSHDDRDGRLKIELELPGVDKKDIKLDMRNDSFCVSAPREDTEYSGCFMLAHEVVPEKTEAKYENGLLQIFAPMKDWDHRVTVMVQ